MSIHEYFGIDPQIVWDAVQQELPLLKVEMQKFSSFPRSSATSSFPRSSVGTHT